MHCRKLIVFAILVFLPALSIPLAAQDLGHKMPGLIGLDAGRIPQPGFYLVNRLVDYEANELRDRRGNVIPVGELKLQGLSNAVGASFTYKFPQRSLFLTATAGVPITRFRLNILDFPEASFDRFGLNSIFIQPARLGWEKEHFDLVGSYAIYIPTDISPLAGGKGVSEGQVTHEFSVGGTIYPTADRDVFVTALGSYDFNLRKRNIDITRGDTFRVQGGVGLIRFDRALEAGVAGYGLWQVRRDRGADIPPRLQGLRDRVYGVGPEAAVLIKSIRAQVRARFEWDFGVTSRPKGHILSVGINFLVWRPQSSVPPP